MNLEEELKNRANQQCELCSATSSLEIYTVPPKTDETIDNCIVVCATCKAQLDDSEPLDANHWRCLNDSMWSEVSAVKVIAYRLLHQLKSEGWTRDLLDMFYIEEEDLKWARETMLAEGEEKVKHVDANGAVLNAGDTVTLIKDLNVKGANFTAKRGTAVRNITLDPDNAQYIEGKVNGQKIVIITDYVKKT